MSDVDDDLEAVVIDNGTWMCKAGYAGDKTAHVYDQCLLGTSLTSSEGECISEYIGEKAWIKRDMLALRCPIERGEITNLDDMEQFLEHILNNELRHGIKERAMLFTEIPNNNKENRHTIVQLLVEKFEVPSLYIEDPATLALYSNGRTTGVVLDVGGSVAHTVAKYKGSTVKSTEHTENVGGSRSNIGGNDVTQHLANIVQKQGIDVSTTSKLLDIELFKHHIAFVPDQSTCKEDTYLLPDKTVVNIQPDICKYSDVLFQPDIIGSDAKGIGQLLNETLQSCDPSIRQEMYSNIILTGGATMPIGVASRLEAELRATVSPETPIKIICPPERRKSSWLGGSILASLSDFSSICKTKQDYYEQGCTHFLHFNKSEIIKNS